MHVYCDIIICIQWVKNCDTNIVACMCCHSKIRIFKGSHLLHRHLLIVTVYCRMKYSLLPNNARQGGSKCFTVAEYLMTDSVVITTPAT